MRLNNVLRALFFVAFCSNIGAVKSPSYFSYTKNDVFKEAGYFAQWAVDQANYNHEQELLKLQEKWLTLLEACKTGQGCETKTFEAIAKEIIARNNDYLPIIVAQCAVIKVTNVHSQESAQQK